MLADRRVSPSSTRADVQDGVAEPLRVLDVEVAPVAVRDGAGVADLAALLGVEVGAVEQQRDRRRRPSSLPARDDGVVLDPADDLRRRSCAGRTSASRRSSAVRP